MSSLTLIVAATAANGIGQGARLPWRLPQEMAYFARVTSSAPEGTMNAVLMGRNTWESIPPKFRPLKDRVNVIVSRNTEYLKENPYTVTETTPPVSLHTNLQDAISHVSALKSVHRCFVIGGASIYNEVLALAPPSTQMTTATQTQGLADRILLTRVLTPAFEDCDVFFPEFREAKDVDGKLQWERSTHEELEAWVGGDVPRGTQQEKGVEYEFQMWMRKTE